MNDTNDPIDFVITSKGWQPGFPRPCVDPTSLAHLLKTREILVEAGILPAIPRGWKPGTPIPLPPGWKHGDPIPPDWPPAVKEESAEDSSPSNGQLGA
jgi:hypothetical protein